MKKALLLSILVFMGVNLFAQLNISYVGSLDYDQDLNDIWGYKASDGTEYALVGVADGFSIVSLADPSTPTQVAFIPGDETIWRDIKSFGDFAYITTDDSNDGLLVVDMTNLPNSVESYFYTPFLLNDENLAECHNIYIDDFGYMYLAGCNVNNGAVLIFDVFTDSYNPIYVNNVPGAYAHDVFVNDNVLYSSNLTSGLQIFDVTDKNNIQLQATQETPFDFTHNAWSTDDNNYVFTTDEKANAPVASYDVSDLNDVKELDQYKPSTTLGDGVIPHNAHVWQNYVIVSYYSDGCIILDTTHPDNLIEVGNFDTYIPAATGFNGAWGAYPYLPSGLILIADIGGGLFVLQPNYVQGCYLEGKVTDITNGNPINNVEIEILSDAPNLDFSDNLGDYKTGQAISGTFDVVFKKTGYQVLTTQAIFENGEITILDVQMIPAQSMDIVGNTLRAADGSPLADVGILAIYEIGDATYTTISDANGTFTLNNVFEGEFKLYSGKWGYLHELEVAGYDPINNSVTISFTEGYQDDFFYDFDWTISGDANAGIWEMGEPDGTYFDELASNTNKDVENDLGEQCFITGNDGGNAGNDDVDGGMTKLSSPSMDLTTYNQPIIKYQSWFFNDGGGGGNQPNDDLVISISNGMTEVILETVTESNSEWRPESEFIVSDFIEVTNDMQFHMEAQDASPGHLVEAALDAFIVAEGMPNSVSNLLEKNIRFEVFPNPFNQAITVELDFEDHFANANLYAFNLLGQKIDFFPLKNNTTKVSLGENWESGIYFLNLDIDGTIVHTLKVVKQ